MMKHESSPRPWGCFLLKTGKLPVPDVFPTPVGVFLPGTGFLPCVKRLPHARGGVSI